jgi:hypothetical protein
MSRNINTPHNIYDDFGSQFDLDTEFDAEGRLLHFKTKLTEVLESMQEENLMRHEIEYMISESF